MSLQSFDLVVAGGLLITPQGSFEGNLGIAGGRIAAISRDRLVGDELIDARGLIVLPGAVDLHVHFNDPGRADWEGWGPGTSAAAAGGVTTVVEMPLNALPPVTTVEALRAKVAAAEGESFVDYALWGGLVTDNLDQLAPLARAGVIGFKAFMCRTGTPEFTHADDGILYAGLREIAALGLGLAVHAESDAITRHYSERLQAAGRRDRRAWGEGRPPVAELEAIHRALFLARQAECPLHVVHLSLPEGAEMIRAARATGQPVTAETCGHYLTLTDDDLDRLGPVAKCAPPLRDAARREALWQALLRGDIDCVASDHSPCPTADKRRGDDDIWAAWGGISGIQTLVPLLLTEGHRKRGLSLERVSHLLAGAPARLARLWPRKGEIRVGADADILLVDLDRTWRVEESHLYSRHRHSPFIGWEMTGSIRQVVLRGRTVARDGEVSGSPAGVWLRRTVGGQISEPAQTVQ